MRWGGIESMKKNLKIIALAGALALCLLMTACYQPPDEVNNGQPTGAVTTSFFNTLAPTATVEVTPDTIAIETQNIFGGQNGQVTPPPTQPDGSGNGWDNWGTAQTTMPGPSDGNMTVTPPSTTDGSIVVETPTSPPTPTPTPGPTPTPKSLQRGFTGSDAVRSVQRRLKELGYYKGSADGDFGPATEEAVKAFQKANGLTADGKVGEKTLSKMNSKNAVTYKEANATAAPKATQKVTNTPKPTATPNLEKDYYLTIGSKGKKVETLQRRLIELGWMTGSVTGNYDEETAAAVSAFQKKTKDLWEDGIAGPDTLRALYSSNASRGTAVKLTSTETLEFGSEGAEVKKLQQKLKDLGYLSGSADGKFGVATQAAVIAFQQNNGLTADGKAGSATLSRIYSDSAVRSGGSAAKIGSGTSSANAGGRDTSDISSTGYITLQEGSEGEAVRTLQKRLKELGYYNGSTDGRFGEGTTAAVMAFQLTNNLTVDGKAGPATQRMLYHSGSAISYAALREGDTGSAVRNLQYTLYELGYYDGSIDGDYGQTTSDAVRAFQIQNKLQPVDGVAGSATLGRLYSSDAVPASAADVSYDTIGPGSKGDDVLQVQDCLIDLGYLQRTTGSYDEATIEAVKAFQRDHGLTADGLAGKKTLELLFGY